MSGPRLLTYRQAADLLGVSPKTIARRVKAGGLAVVVDGGLRRIPEAALARYVAARTVPAREAGGRPRRAARQASGPRPQTTLPGAPGGRVRRLWEASEDNEPG